MSVPGGVRRVVLILAVVVLGAAVPARADGRTTAVLSTCTTGSDPADRAAAFTATMAPLAGAVRMQVHIDLLQRRGRHSLFRAIAVPAWAGWERAAGARSSFVLTRRVDGLLAPAAYRARVTFRWYDAAGRLRRQLVRSTAICEQPDPRPDLAFAGLTATAGPDGQVTYVVAVDNDGRSPAGASLLTLAVDGVPLTPLAVGPLEPGERATVIAAGPACAPGGSVVVTLDADGRIDERNEADDVVTRPCPPAATIYTG